MVVDQMVTRPPDSTTLYTRHAIDNVNAELLPGGLGGVGSGFVAPPYSMASMLYGLGMGVPAAPEKTPLSAEPFRAQFNEPLPGVWVAGAVVPPANERAAFWQRWGAELRLRTKRS
jgi:hypothetical protein